MNKIQQSRWKFWPGFTAKNVEADTSNPKGTLASAGAELQEVPTKHLRRRRLLDGLRSLGVPDVSLDSADTSRIAAQNLATLIDDVEAQVNDCLEQGRRQDKKTYGRAGAGYRYNRELPSPELIDACRTLHRYGGRSNREIAQTILADEELLGEVAGWIGVPFFALERYLRSGVSREGGNKEPGGVAARIAHASQASGASKASSSHKRALFRRYSREFRMPDTRVDMQKALLAAGHSEDVARSAWSTAQAIEKLPHRFLEYATIGVGMPHLLHGPPDHSTLAIRLLLAVDAPPFSELSELIPRDGDRYPSQAGFAAAILQRALYEPLDSKLRAELLSFLEDCLEKGLDQKAVHRAVAHPETQWLLGFQEGGLLSLAPNAVAALDVLRGSIDEATEDQAVQSAIAALSPFIHASTIAERIVASQDQVSEMRMLLERAASQRCDSGIDLTAQDWLLIPLIDKAVIENTLELEATSVDQLVGLAELSRRKLGISLKLLQSAARLAPREVVEKAARQIASEQVRRVLLAKPKQSGPKVVTRPSPKETNTPQDGPLLMSGIRPTENEIEMELGVEQAKNVRAKPILTKDGLQGASLAVKQIMEESP